MNSNDAARKKSVLVIDLRWKSGINEFNNPYRITDQFEEVINKAIDDGYRLRDWKYDTQIVHEVLPNMIETIVAVFELVEMESEGSE
jgi:hypothetical protein